MTKTSKVSKTSKISKKVRWVKKVKGGRQNEWKEKYIEPVSLNH